MNRFHNKYHRHNHHTNPSPNEPDSSHDPIASPEDPFRGDFHIIGQISAKSTVSETLSVKGNTFLNGNVFVTSPITNILERLTIVPKSTTDSFYFKIVDDFANFPLVEFYQNSRPIFFISTAGNVGINTNNPEVQLDVSGDVRFQHLTADKALFRDNVELSSNLTVSGTSLFNAFTALNKSRIGYLDIGYVSGAHAYLETFTGNKDLQIRSNNDLNVTFHPSSISVFEGKVGINIDPPTETLSIVAQDGVGFRTNGFVLVDSTQFDTLRIITNRMGGDDFQHIFAFTYDGRYVVGDIDYDLKYTCDLATPDQPIAVNVDHKIAAFTKDELGSALSLTNTASADDFLGPNIRLYRTDGDFLLYRSTSADQHLGGIEAHGYQTEVCFNGGKNASIEFYAANNYTLTERGGYTVFKTACAVDYVSRERVRFDHNGFVGINTVLAPSGRIIASTLSGVSGRPNVMFEVFDYKESIDPVSVVTAGASATVMTQIIGGSGLLEQIAIRLSDRSNEADSINHIEFTHSSKDTPVVRIASTNRDLSAANGGSLLLATTYLSSIIPFERARITHQGDLGVGITTPHSRAHIHDDDKTFARNLSGFNRDVLTISTLNSTCGFLLSSDSLSSRVYNNTNTKELHITTCTTGGMIKLDVATETPAVVITSAGNVGINIDERLDGYTRNHTNVFNRGVDAEIKLGVNGDVMFFNNIETTPLTGGGARLYFNRDVKDTNTDPIFIHRYNIDTNQSHMRVNIGDETCTPGDHQYTNPGDQNDLFSVGNYSPTLSSWTPWLDVGPCFTELHNNVKMSRDATIQSNLSVMGSARFDQDVNIKGTLSVYNCGGGGAGIPLKVTGDTFIDGNLFVTKNITGFWPNPDPTGSAEFWRPTTACLPSDIKLKTNIVQLTGSLEKIDRIRGVYFDWNEELQPMYKGHDVGVIAQEIEQVLPEVVVEGNTYKKVNYEKIVPLLIECIKELKAEIQLLKNR